MRVFGEDAKRLQAIDLSDFSQVNEGVLTVADDETGFVEWRTSNGELKSKALGAHAIRIITKSPYGR